MSSALITGGLGFIGTNLAKRLARDGWHVTVFDNASRPGVERNLEFLRRNHSGQVHFERGDVRDSDHLDRVVRQVDAVFHFAAQVAVTTSMMDPRSDFEVNAAGTLNVLEAIRSCAVPPTLLFTSTNKVYGGLNDLALESNGIRYQPVKSTARFGISEKHSLDFHSPYGCSKGSADQYVLDYARSYNLPAAVFRMSCIYGPHQMGTEDQGWVAHFLLRALSGEPISICGNGMQVRDVLFVDDLVEAFLCAHKRIGTLSGKAFNIGGGPANTTSLIELLHLIERLSGRKPIIEPADWRVGDQRYYVSDTRSFQAATGWRPRFGVEEGVTTLYEWLKAARSTNWADLPAINEHALLTR